MGRRGLIHIYFVEEKKKERKRTTHQIIRGFTGIVAKWSLAFWIELSTMIMLGVCNGYNNITVYFFFYRLFLI